MSLWNDLANPVFDGVGLAGFKSRANFFFGLSCSIPTIVFYSFSISLLSVCRLVLWVWGLRTDRVYITLAQPCTADLFNNNNNNNNHCRACCTITAVLVAPSLPCLLHHLCRTCCTVIAVLVAPSLPCLLHRHCRAIISERRLTARP